MEETHILRHTVTMLPAIPRPDHQNLNCVVARSNRFTAHRYQKKSPRNYWVLYRAIAGKPQAGLIFAIAAAIWALRNNRAVLVSAFLWVLVFWGGSTIIQPRWPTEWWQAVQVYREQVTLVWLLPQAIVLPLFSRSLSWFAIVATMQVICFPINDLYSSLPILVGWMEMGGWLALVGVSCSWFATVILQNPHHPFVLWLTVLLPYCTCALIHSYTKLKEAQKKKEINQAKKVDYPLLENNRL
jgi:hypothetical protein